MTKATKTIRGLDEALYQKARIDAIKKSITLGQWLNEAIKYYLGGKEIE